MLFDNDTKDIAMDMKLPAEHFDSLQIWVSNYFSDKKMGIDDIVVSTFNE
jgi:hypothetical protein